ncbi:MAG: hypothetical protein HYZ28_29130 [Myxococcales bacterium]|nr:hypothetical protein [Myxococcales bacterium]
MSFSRNTLWLAALCCSAATAQAPYSLPFQLRPAAAGNAVRLDTAIAMVQGVDGASGSTVASMLLVSYQLAPSFAPLMRLGFVSSAPPGGTGGQALVNPALGGTYALKLSEQMRLAFFLGLAFPLGMGGGDFGDPSLAAVSRSGVLARSAMDNAMFAVNDFTVFPGVGFAYVSGGLTAQVEVTVLQLTRVRGERVQKDSSKTNFTSGLHLGYFVHPSVSVGGELRYQRWLSTPSLVTTPDTRDNLTAAAGVRGHFKLGQSTWLRPALAVAMPLDDPMRAQGYRIVQLDLPVAF